MANFLTQEKQHFLKSLYLQGLSIRDSANLAGIGKHTTLRYYKDFRGTLGIVLCACGRQSGHRGWCWHRYQKSPARQNFIQMWTQSHVQRKSPASMPSIGSLWRAEFDLDEFAIRCSYKGCAFPAVIEKKDINAWIPVCEGHRRFMNMEAGKTMENDPMSVYLSSIVEARRHSIAAAKGYPTMLEFSDLHDTEDGRARMGISHALPPAPRD